MAGLIDTEVWAPIVGRLMLAFGTIESCINQILGQQLSQAHLKIACNQRLKQRVDLLSAILPERSLTGNQCLNTLSNLKHVLRLQEKRNLIAHNPLVLSVFEDGDGMSMKEVIYAQHSGRSISLDELRATAHHAENLAELLNNNVVALNDEFWNGLKAAGLNIKPEDREVLTLEAMQKKKHKTVACDENPCRSKLSG